MEVVSSISTACMEKDVCRFGFLLSLGITQFQDETLECAEFYIPNHQRFGGEKIVSYSSIAVDS